MRRALLIFALGLLLLPAGAFAVEPDEILDNPALEERARDISHGLRCLVCQNQSIDDSNAPLARDLRVLVRDRLKEGDTNDEVIDYVVARYGEFVLLQPRFAWHTLVLWIGPFLLLLAGGFAIYLAQRRRGAAPAPSASATLTSAEKRKLAKLLKES
jgi:cytochrome c-type biogenesis protein CcmH